MEHEYDEDIREFLNTGIISDLWNEERVQYAFSLLEERHQQQPEHVDEKLYLPTMEELQNCRDVMESDPGGKEKFNELYTLRQIRDNARFERERKLREAQNLEYEASLLADIEKQYKPAFELTPAEDILETNNEIEPEPILTLEQIRAKRIARFSTINKA